MTAWRQECVHDLSGPFSQRRRLCRAARASHHREQKHSASKKQPWTALHDSRKSKRRKNKKGRQRHSRRPLPTVLFFLPLTTLLPAARVALEKEFLRTYAPAQIILGPFRYRLSTFFIRLMLRVVRLVPVAFLGGTVLKIVP